MLRAISITTALTAVAIFSTVAQAHQTPAPSAAQDSSPASAPAKTADKTAPAKPDAKTAAKKPSAATSATKQAATKDAQTNAPAKASSAIGPTAAHKQTPTAKTGQSPSTDAAKTGPSAATKAGQAATTKTGKAGASKAATAKNATALTLNTPKDKQSYAIGINVGKGLSQNLKQSGVEVDPAILTRAIKDVLAGDKQLMTDQEAQATLTALQTEMRNAQQEKQKLLAETNKKQGDEFLAANKTKDGVVALPDGLQYKILEQGAGPKPAAGDSVTVNYRGTLVNGTEFDSSYKRGQPAEFPVGGVIKGWTEALQLMPVGSKWQVFIPSDLAYGPQGRAPVIGPNSTLVFEVELVSIQPKPAAPAPAPAPAQPSAPNAAPVTTPNPAAPAPVQPAPKPTPTPPPTPTPTPTSKP